MPRATPEPRSGAHQLRRRIPEDVRRLLGGPAVFSFTLWTRDPAKAAAEFRKMVAELEARWIEVLMGRQGLDDETVEALGEEVYHDLLARPGIDRGLWVGHAHAGFRWACDLLDEAMEVESSEVWLPRLEALHGGNLDRVLQARGMTSNEGTRGALLLAAHDAGRQAADVILRQVGGDHVPDTDARCLPAREPDGKAELEAVWAAWTREARPHPKIVERWRPALDRMLGFAGTSDLGGIGEATLQKWIGSLLETMGNNTVGRVHLAAAKRIFDYAVARRLIPLDPTCGLSVDTGRQYGGRTRGYSDDEAALILAACREPCPNRMSDEQRAARRWVPWLCAYTGARVSEMTRLRRCDVVVIRGSAHVRIVPDAGTVRARVREVPLHPDLLDQGFLAFVSTKSGEEPLFHAASERRGDGNGRVPLYREMDAKLAKWVRDLGITDRDVRPGHAWRHRFRTLAWEVGIGERVADALQGRAPDRTRPWFVEVTLQTKEDAIRRIPRFDPNEVPARTRASRA